VLNFLFHKYTFLEHISANKIFRRNLAENLIRSGSGRFQKSDPVKKLPGSANTGSKGKFSRQVSDLGRFLSPEIPYLGVTSTTF
jgi:hypothetical protein